MLSVLKRYSFAFVILLAISLIMVVGTLAIKSFGTMLIEDTNGAINPQEKSRGLK